MREQIVHGDLAEAFAGPGDDWVLGGPEDDTVFDSVKPKIAAALAEAAQSGVRDPHALSQVVRRVIGRWVNQQLRRRPMIVPLVIEA